MTVRLLLSSLLLTLLIVPAQLFALTGKDIIVKSEDAVRGKTLVGYYDVTVKTRRWTRTMRMKSYQDRHSRKSFSEILSPRKDAGNRFLLISDNMWHFVPNIQKTVKISPSMMLQSWMGSDFTNDDIVKESSIIHDYTHTLKDTLDVDGRRCYRVELIPKPNAAVVWGKILYYARTGDCLPVKEEFFNEHGAIKKILTCSGFKNMGGRTIPTIYRMQPVSKKRYTLMEIKAIRFDIAIPGRIFSLQNLTGK